MLVYERRKKTTDTPQLQDTLCMPEAARQQVLADNKAFLFERSLYSVECFQFIHGLLDTAATLGEDFSAIGVDFAVKVVAHSFQNKILSDLVVALLRIFALHPTSCKSFLHLLVTSDVQSLCETLLICTEAETRSALKDLYLGVATLCLTHGAQEEYQEFIDTLLSFAPHELAKHWVRFQQYWELFNKIAELGPEQCAFLQTRGFIVKSVDCYLGKLSPLYKEVRPTIGNSMCLPVFDPMIQTLALICKHCATDTLPGSIELSTADRQCLLANEFFDKTLRKNYDCEALGQIISRFSWEDPVFTKRIAQVLLRGLNKIDHEQLKGYYAVLHALFAVDDSLVRSRIEWLLGFPSVFGERWGGDFLHSFGYGTRHSVEDDMLVYLTTLSFGSSIYDTADSVLALVWKQRKRWDHSCILNIKHLLEVALCNKELGLYLAQMPSASYQYGSFLGWIERYIGDFKRTSYNSNSSKREEYGAEAESLYMKFVELFPEPHFTRHIIGKTLGKRTVKTETLHDVELTITEFTTKWTPATPQVIAQLRSHIPVVESRVPGPPPYVPYNHQPARSAVEFHEAPTVLRFEVSNRTHESFHLEFKFSLGPNVMCPAAGVALELSAYALKEVITINKINPEEDWGPLDFEWSLREPGCFTVLSDFEEYPQESTVYFPTEPLPINLIEPLDQEMKDMGPQKNCPTCTYLNESSANSCVMCQTPIP